MAVAAVKEEGWWLIPIPLSSHKETTITMRMQLQWINTSCIIHTSMLQIWTTLISQLIIIIIISTHKLKLATTSTSSHWCSLVPATTTNQIMSTTTRHHSSTTCRWSSWCPETTARVLLLLNLLHHLISNLVSWASNVISLLNPWINGIRLWFLLPTQIPHKSITCLSGVRWTFGPTENSTHSYLSIYFLSNHLLIEYNTWTCKSNSFKIITHHWLHSISDIFNFTLTGSIYIYMYIPVWIIMLFEPRILLLKLYEYLLISVPQHPY